MQASHSKRNFFPKKCYSYLLWRKTVFLLASFQIKRKSALLHIQYSQLMKGRQAPNMNITAKENQKGRKLLLGSKIKMSVKARRTEQVVKLLFGAQRSILEGPFPFLGKYYTVSASHSSNFSQISEKSGFFPAWE